LDIRLRLPDWVEGLEAPVRAAITKGTARGNVTLGLRLSRDSAQTSEKLDLEALARAMDHLKRITVEARRAGVTLAPATAVDLLSLRGVLVSHSGEEDTGPLVRAILASLPGVLSAFEAMRQSEGAALASVLGLQLDKIEALTGQAAELAEARKDQMGEKLQENLARILENAEGMDPARVAQELALIAVKTDVTEEIDRLGAHVTAARDLLAQTGPEKGPVGRKLDFLSQEFNREANTLCSKSQSAALTRVGLDLKATIDQMREQVQNVE
jgi:uncharacterized protein (TIGR00255 family)